MDYYNENDPHSAAWLRALIDAALIPPGVVDERSICEVNPDELHDYTQCHFFAGIGGWSRALQLAGWPDDRPVWTGSCPCQPYSVGNVAHGGAKGSADGRDLWPKFFRLIRERKPPVVFGEQVASAVAWGWWDRAAMDLEGEAYAVASAIVPACFVGAEHERKRLWWVAHSSSPGWKGHQPVQCVPEPAQASLSVYGDPLVGARRALAGDYSDLLPCDGISVVMERSALKGYGNAIVPKVAAQILQAMITIDNAPNP